MVSLVRPPSPFGYGGLRSFSGGGRRMLELHRKLPDAKTPHGRAVIERDVAATDRRIDDLVYDLYGLTAKERRIMEGAAERR
jgi:hypothetical protein